MRWAEHAALMVDRRGAYRVLMGNLGERDYLEDPGVDGGIFRKWDVETWTGTVWLRIGER
jgi:hypothetical protein